MKNKKQSVSAEWSADLWVKCPQCKKYQEIKYQEIDEWWDIFNVCANENIEYEHICEECKKPFSVTSTSW